MGTAWDPSPSPSALLSSLPLLLRAQPPVVKEGAGGSREWDGGMDTIWIPCTRHTTAPDAGGTPLPRDQGGGVRARGRRRAQRRTEHLARRHGTATPRWRALGGRRGGWHKGGHTRPGGQRRASARPRPRRHDKHRLGRGGGLPWHTMVWYDRLGRRLAVHLASHRNWFVLPALPALSILAAGPILVGPIHLAESSPVCPFGTRGQIDARAWMHRAWAAQHLVAPSPRRPVAPRPPSPLLPSKRAPPLLTGGRLPRRGVCAVHLVRRRPWHWCLARGLPVGEPQGGGRLAHVCRCRCDADADAGAGAGAR